MKTTTENGYWQISRANQKLQTVKDSVTDLTVPVLPVNDTNELTTPDHETAYILDQYCRHLFTNEGDGRVPACAPSGLDWGMQMLTSVFRQ